jgi:hypothetical protein
MRALRSGLWLLAFALPTQALAHTWESPGRLVGVSVELEGASAPLYPAPDGSGRLYFEARQGARYDVRLTNRTAERLGVVVVVDGLNAVSGERDPGADRSAWTRPGRMYVLDPWDVSLIRGWRTSTEEVRRFTFVDEKASYAARSGKANGKMGWIEVVVYREHRAYWRRWWDEGRGRVNPGGAPGAAEPRPEGYEQEEARRQAPPATTAAAPPPSTADSADGERMKGEGYAGGAAPAPRRSYPGTGWGAPTQDHVEIVSFEPEPRPAETLTLRYEYASALRALGIYPPQRERDRLAERERGINGFAQPPQW